MSAVVNARQTILTAREAAVKAEKAFPLGDAGIERAVSGRGDRSVFKRDGRVFRPALQNPYDLLRLDVKTLPSHGTLLAAPVSAVSTRGDPASVIVYALVERLCEMKRREFTELSLSEEEGFPQRPHGKPSGPTTAREHRSITRVMHGDEQVMCSFSSHHLLSLKVVSGSIRLVVAVRPPQTACDRGPADDAADDRGPDPIPRGQAGEHGATLRRTERAWWSYREVATGPQLRRTVLSMPDVDRP